MFRDGQVPYGLSTRYLFHWQNGKLLPAAHHEAEAPASVADALNKLASGPLVGVSNNVNYDVNGDGSAVFNMNIGYQFIPLVPEGCLYPGFSVTQGSPLACIP
jgi:hypothetical protein